MTPGAYGGGQLFGIVLTLLIVITVIFVRNRRPRRLRLEAMWVRPLIILAIVGLALTAAPPPLTPMGVGILVLAAVIGAGAGWLRGGLMRIDVHPETHDISTQASPAGMLFILAVVGVRMYLRGAASQVIGLPAATIADALILLAGAMLTVQNLEMWLRARRLLGAARAGSEGPPQLVN